MEDLGGEGFLGRTFLDTSLNFFLFVVFIGRCHSHLLKLHSLLLAGSRLSGQMRNLGLNLLVIFELLIHELVCQIVSRACRNLWRKLIICIMAGRNRLPFHCLLHQVKIILVAPKFLLVLRLTIRFSA